MYLNILELQLYFPVHHFLCALISLHFLLIHFLKFSLFLCPRSLDQMFKGKIRASDIPSCYENTWERSQVEERATEDYKWADIPGSQEDGFMVPLGMLDFKVESSAELPTRELAWD